MEMYAIYQRGNQKQWQIHSAPKGIQEKLYAHNMQWIISKCQNHTEGALYFLQCQRTVLVLQLQPTVQIFQETISLPPTHFTAHSAPPPFSLFTLHEQHFHCSFCTTSVFNVHSAPPVFSVFILNKVFSVHSACTVFSQFILPQQCFHSSFCTTSVFTVQCA